MQNQQMISVATLCLHHRAEQSFFHSLSEYGLIEIVTSGEEEFIPEATLPEVEKFLRLHYELDINLEGIDAIAHLLQKVNGMHEEITALKNRLRGYEAEEK